jgi:hypothetical protein
MTVLKLFQTQRRKDRKERVIEEEEDEKIIEQESWQMGVKFLGAVAHLLKISLQKNIKS